jgi:hypothetical protein
MNEQLPPPYEPPLADGCPPALRAFLYYLMRDYLPVGFVEGVVMQVVMEQPQSFTNEHLLDTADKLARQLSYDPSS